MSDEGYGQDPGRTELQYEDEEVRAFADKFNIPMKVAARLLALRRVAQERENKKPRR